MQIAERIKKAALPVVRGVRVRDVRIGLVYTVVMLEDGRACAVSVRPEEQEASRGMCGR
jgi:uncharacterized protein (DUF4213/DUF364 family)